MDKPIIVKIDALTDEYIEKWSKPFQYYSGEEKYRYIYAEYHDGYHKDEKFVYKIESVYAEPIEKMSYKDREKWEEKELGKMYFLYIKEGDDN